jgi:hypothetical protein
MMCICVGYHIWICVNWKKWKTSLSWVMTKSHKKLVMPWAFVIAHDKELSRGSRLSICHSSWQRKMVKNYKEISAGCCKQLVKASHFTCKGLRLTAPRTWKGPGTTNMPIQALHRADMEMRWYAPGGYREMPHIALGGSNAIFSHHGPTLFPPSAWPWSRSRLHIGAAPPWQEAARGATSLWRAR